MPPRRQTLPLAQIRAPEYIDDQMSQAQTQVVAGRITNAEQLMSVIASQIRLAQGSRGWLQPPAPVQVPPDPTDPAAGYLPGVGQIIVDEQLSGAQDGANRLFQASHYFVAASLVVRFNGAEFHWGQEADYIPVEGGGPGTGYNLIRLTGALPPLPRDRLTASYIRAA